MQHVSNCLIFDGEGYEEKILMLQKPRRGWWYPPGGKVDPGETVQEAAKREVEEETHLTIPYPRLRGIFTILKEKKGVVSDEWMLFTFVAPAWAGKVHQGTHEGRLEWVIREEILRLPMPEGDRLILSKLLNEKGIWIGRFVYGENEELIHYELHEG